MQSSYGTFEAFQGFRVDDLIAAGHSEVIAMPNMEPGWLQQFFVDLILLQALRGRIERSQRVDRTDVLFVIEEADADLHMHTEQSFSSRMSPISECFKRAREFGIGVIAAVSSLRSISPLVRENATTHIMFRAPDAFARAEAAQTLSLPRGGELTLDHLPKGQCLVKQAGPWPHAMRVQVDRMLPCRTKATHYDRHPHVPSQPLAQMPELRQALHDMLDAATKRQASNRSTKLSEEAATLLKLTIAHSFIPVARLFEKIGLPSFSRQKAIRKELEDRKLAHFEETRIGKINVLLMEAAEAGYVALELKLNRGGNQGRGTLTHRSFAHWVKWHFERQGLTTLIEGVVPGTRHATDVLVKAPRGKCLAIEICVTCSDNLLSHCFACFEESTEVEGMTVITSTKSEARELKLRTYSALALKAYTERIVFETIENYVPRATEP